MIVETNQTVKSNLNMKKFISDVRYKILGDKKIKDGTLYLEERVSYHDYGYVSQRKATNEEIEKEMLIKLMNKYMLEL